MWNKARGRDFRPELFAEVLPGIEHGEPYRAYLRGSRPAPGASRSARAGYRQSLGRARRLSGAGWRPCRRLSRYRRAQAADAQLRQSEERLRLMVEALPDFAFVIRPDGIAEDYNKQMRDYSAGDRAGSADRSRCTRRRTANGSTDARLGFATGTEFTVEARMRRHDGIYRWHRIRNRPIRIDGEIAFWLGTASISTTCARPTPCWTAGRRAHRRTRSRQPPARGAIDEREKAEAQLRQAQRIEAVGQLTSGIAHDFNNLLTAIIGNLELLETRIEETDVRLARLLAAARAAAERGARLTAQFLAFSRQQRMTPEPIDLNRIVAGSAAAAQHDWRGGRDRHRAGQICGRRWAMPARSS